MLGRNGQNICDVPVIEKQTIRFEFLDNKLPTTTHQDTAQYTTYSYKNPNSPVEKTTVVNKKHWWWRPEPENGRGSDNTNNNNIDENQILVDGFVIDSDKNVDKDSSLDKTTSNNPDPSKNSNNANKSKDKSQPTKENEYPSDGKFIEHIDEDKIQKVEATSLPEETGLLDSSNDKNQRSGG